MSIVDEHIMRHIITGELQNQASHFEKLIYENLSNLKFKI